MDYTITNQDDYKIFDKLGSSKTPGPKGWVRAFLHNNPNFLGKPFHEGPNLIVGKGREFAAQRLFNTTNGSGNSWTDYSITDFGVGSGGAEISSSVPIITDPTLDDVGLFNPIELSSAFNVESSSSTAGVIKPITTDGSITLMDGEYGSNTYYSKTKCVCVVDANEPTSLGVGDSQQISEAGLYFSSGTTNVMFSHICFAPKWKESDSILTIEWYIIC